LLFDSTPHRYIDIEQFIFTKEAHLLPLNLLLFNINDTLRKEFDKTTLLPVCIYEQKNRSLTERLNDRRAKQNQYPAMDDQFKSHQYKEQLRRNIRGDQDMTETITTTSTIEIEKRTKNESNQRVTASDFSAGDPEHVSQLTQMGIQIQTMTDGRKKTNYFFLLILMRI
jgi:isocitrate dehydrogenase